MIEREALTMQIHLQHLSKKTYLIIGTLLILLITLTVKYTLNQTNTVTLSGTLVTQMYYGPPNYGENPDTDVKEYPYILILNEAKNLKAESQEGEKIHISTDELQLVFVDGSIDKADALIGENIKVKGNITEAFTGHHHKDYILIVSDIK